MAVVGRIEQPFGGYLEIEAPVQCGARWHVKGTDTALGQSTEKVFATRARAQGWIDELLRGRPLAAPPMAPTAAGVTRGVGAATGVEAPITAGHQGGRADRGKPHASINLRSVAETLDRYGLDPFEEVAKIMTAEEAVTGSDGQPVIDPVTGAPLMRPVLDHALRAKVALELGQYVKPKLKSIEMKVEDARQLSEAQIDAKLAQLLAKGAKT